MTSTFAVLSLVATGICVAALLALHLLPTGYAPWRNAVSDFGVGRFHRLYQLQASALGTAGILLAVALAHAVDPAPVTIVVLLVVFGAARLVIGFFPTDLDRSHPTRVGVIHLFLAAIAFVAIAIAAGKLHTTVHHLAAWSSVHPALKGLGWAVVGTSIATGLALRRPQLQPVFGLIERGLYVAMIGWFAVVAAHLA